MLRNFRESKSIKELESLMKAKSRFQTSDVSTDLSTNDNSGSESSLRMGLLCVGVSLVAMAALLFEVTLTRVFAVLMWYHFAYMAVSLALLGFGASGSLLTALRVVDRKTSRWNWMAIYSTGFGVAIMFSFLIVSRISIDSLQLWKSLGNLFGLLLTFVILSVAFLFAGLAIGSSFSWNPQSVGKIYFFDLLGSAVGGLGAPLLLSHLRTDAVIMVAALIAFVAGAVFASMANPLRRLMHAIPVIIGIVLVIGFAGGTSVIPALSWHIPFAPHKVFVEMFFPQGISEKTLPSATAQVDVSNQKNMPMFMASDFGPDGLQPTNLRGVTQDGTAPTAMYENAGNYEQFSAFNNAQAATSFLAYASAGKSEPEVLIIGVGGGPDVMMSLFYGAKKVTAVDVNTAMIKMVREDYADYIGHLFDNPKIHLINDEGRSYLKRSNDNYDIIQLSGVDTYTALSTGAYTLSEAYLYTVEALMDMYSRLKEDGYINYSRLILTTPDQPPRETLRLANIARMALERMGVEDPSKNIAVFQGVGWASTIIRKGPFTEKEITTLRSFAKQQNFLGLIFDPLRPFGQPADNSEEYFFKTRAATLATAEELKGRGDVSELLITSLRSALKGDVENSNSWISLAAAELTKPDQNARDTEERLRANRDAAVTNLRDSIAYRKKVLTYYETMLRGPDQERKSFLENYFYDLYPVSDDKPFFFDYYKMSGILRSSHDVKWNTGSEALPGFPVGHAILISSLAQITILAAILILLPLKFVSKSGYERRERLRFFIYFAALGCGFMFVEISLMQKFTLFLGHPTYSLSVVLSSILAFSGLGALASSRVKEVSRRLMVTMLLIIAGLIVFDGFAANWVIHQAMGLELPYRILTSVMFLSPTAFALGFPFPIGIRLLKQEMPVLIPWGWAINGFLSVAGSLLAIMVAMAFGFSAVLLVGAVIYTVGFLAIASARFLGKSPVHL